MLYEIAKGIVSVIFTLGFRVKVTGRENVPESGPFILAVNHKSNFDPAIAAVYCPRKLTFMAKEELFKNPLFGGLIRRLGAFPISRGKGDIGAIKGAFSILKDGRALLMFPQGHRMKNGQRGKAGTGAVMIAHKMQVPVVTLCISGEYRFMGRLHLTFGSPIEFTEYYGEKMSGETLKELSEGLLDKILENDDMGRSMV